MSDFSTIYIRCGLFKQTHKGEYPSLCAKCAEYMKNRKLSKAGGNY